MKAEWQARVDDLFNDALEVQEDQREAFLLSACGGDRTLMDDVRSLLSAHDRSRSFLDQPVAGKIPASVAAHVTRDEIEDELPRPGERVGAYRLVSLIASGGMGAVFRAVRDDGSFDREVAIKLIRGGPSSEAARRRFQRERQTLARLEHPNISRLLDGGTMPDGTPYLVMELIAGTPIDEFAAIHQLPPRERLELFRHVCDAVHFAHQNLILHRDLKPRNILVTTAGAPMLLDFGIARLIDDGTSGPSPEVTRTMCRAMTPRYASPEQIRGEPLTTASDVFSLGVILYELLTERRPFDTGGLSEYEAQRAVCDTDPIPPSAAARRGVRGPTEKPHSAGPASVIGMGCRNGGGPASSKAWRRQLRGDLDTIVLTAIARDPRRRYASALQFADDIRRYLAGHPVSARKDTIAYRVSKLVRRNKAASIASAAFVIALLVGIAGTTTGMLRARQEQRRAEHERALAVEAQSDSQAVTRYLQDVLAAANPYRTAKEFTILELLADAESRIETELGGKPAVEAAVRYAIADTYGGMWVWERALPQAEAALRLTQRLEGERSEAAARCLCLYGRALTFAWDERAEAVQRESLAIRRSLFGHEHPQVAESTACLAFSLWSGRKAPQWEEADRLYAEALTIYERVGQSHQDDHARISFSHGVMLTNMGRLAEAEPRFREAIRLFRATNSRQNRYRVECLKKFAVMLITQRRFEEAESVLGEALAGTPAQFLIDGWDAPDWSLARVRAGQNRFDEADLLFRQSLARQCLFAAEHDSERDEPLRRLAGRLNDPAPSEIDALYVEAFRILSSPESMQKGGIAMRFQDVAELRLRNDSAACWIEPLESAWQRQKANLGETHAIPRRTGAILGEALIRSNAFERAEAILLGLYQTTSTSTTMQDEAPTLAKRLVFLYRQWGRLDDAARWALAVSTTPEALNAEGAGASN